MKSNYFVGLLGFAALQSASAVSPFEAVVEEWEVGSLFIIGFDLET